LVDRARRRFTLESGIKSLAALIARLRASEDPSLADPLVPEITKAEAEIGAINAELRQVDGAVVNDAG
jgi:hypothetical protein